MESSLKVRKLSNILFYDKVNKDEIKIDIQKKLEEITISINQNLNQNFETNPNIPINQNYYGTDDIKFLVLPNSKFNFINLNLTRAYANLKASNNFSKIKRIFFLAHPFRGKVNKIYLSAYDSYETIFSKKFDIDKEIYEELKEDPQNTIKQHIINYPINSYNVTSYEEVNTTGRLNIIEQIQSVNESEEDYDFSFDLHLNYLSILYEQEDIKIVPIWFKTNMKDGKDKFVTYLNNFLCKQLANEENILICSSNLTYFGRNYNYFGNIKEYKNRTYLRLKENEPKILKHVESLDLEAIELMLKCEEKNFLKITNFNFCKDIFMLLIKLSQNLKLKMIFKNHLCLKFDSRDQLEYELNFCTIGNFIAFAK